MDLGWLKYVSFACAAGAFFLYLALRSRKLPSIPPMTKVLMMGAFTILACTTWHLQETNAEQNSPRKLVVGRVATVHVTTDKYGSVSEKFQLSLDDGSLSPWFYAGSAGKDRSDQPIHIGDVLGVLYRTWDNVLVTVDEPEGQRAGWHYRQYRLLDPFVWTVGGVGFFFFLGALAGVLIGRRRATASSSANT